MCKAHVNHYTLPWLIVSTRLFLPRILSDRCGTTPVDIFDAVLEMESEGAPRVPRFHRLI